MDRYEDYCRRSTVDLTDRLGFGQSILQFDCGQVGDDAADECEIENRRSEETKRGTVVSLFPAPASSASNLAVARKMAAEIRP